MAVKKPQKLGQILAELEPAFANQRGIYNKQLTAIPGQYDIQEQGLNVAKTNEFREINRGANARNMAFSGVPAEEQMRYVGEKFLPALAGLEEQENQQSLALQMAMAELDSQKRLKGLDIRGQQTTAYQAWQEAERDRQFRAREALLARQAAAAEAAADRAASAANARIGSQGETVSPDEVAISMLKKGAGGDSFVSPNTFRDARAMYIQAGGNNKDFMNKYWRYTGVEQGKNKNWRDYYYS